MILRQGRDYNSVLKSVDICLDYVLNFLVSYVAFLATRMMMEPEAGFAVPARVFLSISIICLFVLFLYNYHNVYLPMRTKSPLFFLARILLTNMEVFAVLAVGILIFFRDGTGRFYLIWVLVSDVFSFVVIASKKISMMFVLHSMRSRRKNIKRILLITDSQEISEGYLEEIRHNPQFGYEVIGYVGNLSVPGLVHLGTTGDLDRVLTEQHPDEVVMAFDTVRKKVITRYISTCNNHCIKVLFIPAICGYFKSPRQIDMLGNIPMVDIRSTPLDSATNRFVKRLMDIVGSLFLIVLTSPLMLFTAIGVKLSSPGPILFRQTRVGRNNEEFTMYKFRSMRVNDRQQTGWSTETDPRKTRFGNFIRKFALDELPQFFNVLKGDMSLVGPRPEVPFYVEKFKNEIPLYMLKHTLRPGITGQAQIKGLRGDTSIQARIEEDINYIENWTIWRDIHILLLTPFRAVNRHEKYAQKEQQLQQPEAETASGAAAGEPEAPRKKEKLLYVASTVSHLQKFHQPYLQRLREEYDLYLMAPEGEGIDFPVAFRKSFFSPTNLSTVFRIRKILRREQFDRVILNTSLAAALVRLAMVGMSHRPYVINLVHGYLFGLPVSGAKAHILLWCEQLLRRYTDTVMVMNEEDAQIAEKYHLYRSRLIRMSGMGVKIPAELPARDETLRSYFLGDREGILCCFAGELSRRKNQIFLIRCVAQLRKEGIPLYLLLPGDGDQKEILQREIRRLHLKDVVFLPGNVESVRPYLGITDLYVSASSSEGLPFNVMEAMSCGLRMVLSDVKGQRDLASLHPECLYRPEEQEDFCRAVKEAIRKPLGCGAVRYPELEKYRLEAVLEQNLKDFCEEGSDNVSDGK